LIYNQAIYRTLTSTKTPEFIDIVNAADKQIAAIQGKGIVGFLKKILNILPPFHNIQHKKIDTVYKKLFLWHGNSKRPRFKT